MSKTKVAFAISTFNKKRNCESSFSDTAIRTAEDWKATKALEDEANDGELYGAYVYKYKKKFNMDIAIDIDRKLFVVLREDTNHYSTRYCPFDSKGTLRLK